VLGGALTPIAGLDVRLTGMLLYRNGVPIDSDAVHPGYGFLFERPELAAAGAAALGNPAAAFPGWRTSWAGPPRRCVATTSSYRVPGLGHRAIRR
jgi:hypothetical protein